LVQNWPKAATKPISMSPGGSGGKLTMSPDSMERVTPHSAARWRSLLSGSQVYLLPKPWPTHMWA